MDKVDSAEAASGGVDTGTVSFDALSAEFTTPAWAGLRNSESAIFKFLNAKVFTIDEGESGRINTTRLKLYGLLHCEGSIEVKAKYLLAQFQGGFDKAESISAVFGNIGPAISALCELSTWGLYEHGGKLDLVTNYYGDDHSAIDDAEYVIQEDQFLEDIFGLKPTLPNEAFINNLLEKAYWIFDAVELRRRLFQVAEIEAKHLK